MTLFTTINMWWTSKLYHVETMTNTILIHSTYSAYWVFSAFHFAFIFIDFCFQYQCINTSFVLRSIVVILIINKLCAPSHRQDSTHHGLCYVSRGALTGTRSSSTSPPWEIDPTTHGTMSGRSTNLLTTSCSSSDPCLMLIVQIVDNRRGPWRQCNAI